MPINTFKSFFALLIISATLLSSCKKDKCDQTITYKKYEPIFMSYTDLRAAVKTEQPRALKAPGKIYFKGNYIFINEVDKGIHVIDNSNPSSPQNIAFINIPGNIDIAAVGNTLYADSYIDLLSFDISSPQNSTLVNRQQNALPERVFTDGHYADTQKGVVIDWTESIVTEETNGDCTPGSGNIMWGWNEGDAFTNSTQGGGPTKTSTSAPGTGGSMARFTIANNTLYVVDQSSLRTFNISSPTQPTSMGTSYIGRNIETIFPHNNHLFIGSTNGMYIYNISNPAAPQYVSTYIHGTACDPVVVDDKYAYITLRSGTPCNTSLNQLEVVNIQNLSTPTLSHTVLMTNPHGLAKKDNHLFICDGTAGLKVFDATNPINISNTPMVTFAQVQAYDVIAYSNTLLMIGEDGFYQYDCSNIENITLLSKIVVQK